MFVCTAFVIMSLGYKYENHLILSALPRVERFDSVPDDVPRGLNTSSDFPTILEHVPSIKPT